MGIKRLFYERWLKAIKWTRMTAAEFMPVMFVILVVIGITNLCMFQLVKLACQPPSVRYHLKYHTADQGQPTEPPTPYYTEVRHARQ